MGMGPPPSSQPGRPRRPSWQASHSAPYDNIPYDTYNVYNAPNASQNLIPLQTNPATHPTSRPITNTHIHNPRASLTAPIPVSSEFSSLPEVVPPHPQHTSTTALLSPTDPSHHPVSPLSAWGSPLPPSASPCAPTTSPAAVSPNTTGTSANTTSGRTRPPRRPAAFSPDSYDALNPNHTSQTQRPPRNSSSPNTAAYINDESPASPPPQPPCASLAASTSPPFSPPAPSTLAFPSQPQTEQQGGYVRPPLGTGPGLAMGIGVGGGGRYGRLKPVGQHGELLDRKRRRRRRIYLLVWGSVGIVLLVIALIVGVVVGVLKGRNGGK